MKTKFTNNEIGHAWFHHTEADDGSANSMFFEGDTIYSYNRTFPIARKHVMQGVHLFTSRDFSITTSSHKSSVYSAMRGNGEIFEVDNVLANNKRDHKANYASMKDELQRKLVTAARARTNKDLHLHDASKLVDSLNAYSKTFKLGFKAVVMPDLADIAAATKREQIKDKKRNAARLAKLQRENADKIQAWIAGDAVRLPRIDKVYLRVVGDKVETSHGVDFPVTDASRAFKLIKRCKDNKTSWKRNGENIGLGYYKVDAIRSNGTVVAGCHTVQYDEIKRIATIINAPIA